MSPKSARRLLVVVNLGTPSAPEPGAVREFLQEFLSDPHVIDFPAWLWKPLLNRIILPRRAQRVAELYQSIWTDGGSPLEVGTRRIADALRARVGDATEIQWAYRYGRRSVTRNLAGWLHDDLEEIVVVPLYAQRTSSTTGTMIDETCRVARQLGVEDRLRICVPAPDDAGYAQANADRYATSVSGLGWEPEHVLLSFHGIPARHDRREGGCYSSECKRSAAAIVAAMGWSPDQTTLCYQSKFGPERWLTPATAALLEELPRRGIHRLAVMTPGFFTEGLETLEEIAIQGAKIFQQAGGTHYVAVPTAQDHPALIASLAGFAGLTEPTS